MKRTPLIAIEGIDGSGKGTQARMLLEALQARGLRVAPFSFPAYQETLAGSLVAAYLNGDMGEPRAIDSRLTAVLYAIDRFERKEAMLAAQREGAIVLCDRYVGSNLAHQVARAPAPRRAALRAMIERLEYEVFGLPRPELVLFLDMPAPLAQQRVKTKGARAYTRRALDAHEADRNHLLAALSEYRRQARRAGWVRIPTVGRGGQARSREEIHADLLTALVQAQVLAEKPSTPSKRQTHGGSPKRRRGR